MNVLPFEKQVQAVSALVDGCSIRTAERITGTNRGTIMHLGARVGEGCARLHDRLMRGLQVSLLQFDEQWAYVAKKQRRVKEDDPAEFGDSYVFIALDATSKAVVSYLVGKRHVEDTRAFVADVRSRVVNRPQVTSDGFQPYVEAVDGAFGSDVDFAQLVKVYHGEPARDAARSYSPGRIIGTEQTIHSGSPDVTKISTSYVERFNLTTRMASRRFTRLTNGFSKKLENHIAAVALHIAHYNLCRVHEALRVTPAMQLGLTDHVWSVGELIQAALAEEEGPAGSPAPSPEFAPAPQRPALRVVREGRPEGGRA